MNNDHISSSTNVKELTLKCLDRNYDYVNYLNYIDGTSRTDYFLKYHNPDSNLLDNPFYCFETHHLYNYYSENRDYLPDLMIGEKKLNSEHISSSREIMMNLKKNQMQTSINIRNSKQRIFDYEFFNISLKKSEIMNSSNFNGYNDLYGNQKIYTQICNYFFNQSQSNDFIIYSFNLNNTTSMNETEIRKISSIIEISLAESHVEILKYASQPNFIANKMFSDRIRNLATQSFVNIISYKWCKFKVIMTTLLNEIKKLNYAQIKNSLGADYLSWMLLHYIQGIISKQNQSSLGTKSEIDPRDRESRDRDSYGNLPSQLTDGNHSDTTSANSNSNNLNLAEDIKDFLPVLKILELLYDDEYLNNLGSSLNYNSSDSVFKFAPLTIYTIVNQKMDLVRNENFNFSEFLSQSSKSKAESEIMNSSNSSSKSLKRSLRVWSFFNLDRQKFLRWLGFLYCVAWVSCVAWVFCVA